MREKSGFILVTGGNGYIGKAVIQQLRKIYPIVSFDLKKPKALLPGVSYEEVDISSQESIREALNRVRDRYGNKIRSVVHLAAYYSFSGRPTDLYDKVTVHGTEVLVEEIKRFNVEQFIFSSTMLVYPPTELGSEISERSPVRPLWDYPQSKVNAEKELSQLHGNIPIVRLRIAGVYDDMCHSIPLARQIQRIYERQLTSHLFPGDRKHGQAFLHLEDLVEAVELLIQKRSNLPNDLTLLVGEPETLSYEELQNLMSSLLFGSDRYMTLRIPSKVAKIGAWFLDRFSFRRDIFIKPWMIKFADDNYDLDISRIQLLLNWMPKHSLETSLPYMIESLKADPKHWYLENHLEYPSASGRFIRAAIRPSTLIPLIAASLVFVEPKPLRTLTHVRRKQNPALPKAV